MSTSFKVVFLGRNDKFKNALLTSIKQERAATNYTEGICSTFEKRYAINGKSSKVEFIDTNDKDEKDVMKKITSGDIIVISLFLAYRKSFEEELKNYKRLTLDADKFYTIICGFRNNNDHKIISKRKIKQTKDDPYYEYKEVDLMDYNTTKEFVDELLEMIRIYDDIGHPRKDGIKYICYRDQTCVAVDQDEIVATKNIPNKITYKFKEYTVKGIGYLHKKYQGGNFYYYTKNELIM